MIHFDSGHDCLHRREPKNGFCTLKLQVGHCVLNADDNERPYTSQRALIAVRKPPQDPRKLLALIPAGDHRVWGHLSAEAVAHISAVVEGFRRSSI